MSRKYRAPVSPMFAESHEDLPLFSQTPLEVEEKPWNPQARSAADTPTADMFADVPSEELATADNTAAELVPARPLCCATPFAC
jgi:hypothetical protein